MSDEQQAKQYYENYDECGRLELHQTEFVIRIGYLDRYVTAETWVLDIGGVPERCCTVKAKHPDGERTLR